MYRTGMGEILKPLRALRRLMRRPMLEAVAMTSAVIAGAALCSLCLGSLKG